MTGSRAICTDILHFPARVLVIQAARRGYGRAPLIPDTVLPVYSGDRAIRFSRAVAAGRTGPGSGPGQGCWQCLAARQTEKASKALTFPPDRGFGDGQPATLRLYLAGKIDQWWIRQTQTGPVFLLNVTSVEEARTLMESLPLGERG